MAVLEDGDNPFFLIHHDLPREGPGTDETTRAAIERLPPLPEGATVLDLGADRDVKQLFLLRPFKNR